MSGTVKIRSRRVADLLVSLVDKSLIVYEPQPGGPGRYRLLETTRQYAREKLQESGKEAVTRRKHLTHFLELAEEAEPQLMGREQGAWLDRLEAEHDNLRTALARCEEETEAGLRLAGALGTFWVIRGHWSTGRAHLVAALSRAGGQGRTPAWAKALHEAGVLADHQGDYTAARLLHEESQALFRELGDKSGITGSLNNLGDVATDQGDYASAQILYEESLALGRELGDRQGVAWSLNNLGDVACYQGDYTAARLLHEESLMLRRQLGDKGGIAHSLNALGSVTFRLGDDAGARALYEESLAVFRELENKRCIAWLLNNLASVVYIQSGYASAQALYAEGLTLGRELGDKQGVAQSLEGMAVGLLGQAEARKAVYLWGAAQALRESIGSPLPPNEREQYDCDLARGREALDEEAFAAAWAEGRAMTLEQAIAYALEEHGEQAG